MTRIVPCPRKRLFSRNVVKGFDLLRFWILGLVVACLVAIASAPVAASERHRRIVLVVAGNVSVRDLADPKFPHINRLLSLGSIGLMNVRTGRPNKLMEIPEKPGMEARCVSIGAGAMAVGGAEVRRAANVDQLVGSVPAGKLWACRTGGRLSGDEVVHPEIALIQRINGASTYRAKPGLLGSVLRLAGMRTAVIGNSSIPGEQHAEACAIVMDERGTVALGDVSSRNLVEFDEYAPYGIRTNLAHVVRMVDRALVRCKFVVVDIGDTYRADRYGEYCTDAQAAIIRRWAIGRLDKLIGLLMSRLDFDADSLILVSPSPRAVTEMEGERLTPLVIYGPGFRGGLLTSPSTRRTGIVTICDVAPTVLSILGLRIPNEMTGRPVYAVPNKDPRPFLLDLNLRAILQSQRQILVRATSILYSAVVVLVTFALLMGSAKARTIRVACWGALIPPAMVLAVVYTPLLYSGGLFGTAMAIAGLTLLVLLVFGYALKEPRRVFVWLCVALIASILIDLLRGAVLISSCVAGYGLVEGARYYGLGNELMGSLLGAALVGTGMVLKQWERKLRRAAIAFAVILGIVFVFTGWPTLGANMGGAMSTAAALAAALFVLWGCRLSLSSVIVVVAVALLAAASMFAVDLLRAGGAQSHIGRLAEAASSGKLAGALVIAQRKIALNLMLVSTSVWSKLLGLSVAASLVMYAVSRRKHGSGLGGENRVENATLAGGLVGTIAAFAFNDSGVLAAAACAVILWCYIALRYGESLSQAAERLDGSH